MAPALIARPSTLAGYLQRNSCLRRPSSGRQKEGHRTYKKGWELRIVLDSKAELTQLRRLLRAAGHLPARAYRKRLQWVQPVYGHAAVKALLPKARA